MFCFWPILLTIFFSIQMQKYPPLYNSSVANAQPNFVTDYLSISCNGSVVFVSQHHNSDAATKTVPFDIYQLNKPFRFHLLLHMFSACREAEMPKVYARFIFCLQIIVNAQCLHMKLQNTVRADDEPYVPRKEVNTALATNKNIPIAEPKAPTKNIAGPPVYYPPGQELFAKSQAQAAWRAKVT